MILYKLGFLFLIFAQFIFHSTTTSCMLAEAHQILWTRERVTPYATNTMGEIQTWRLVLLCLQLVISSCCVTNSFEGKATQS